jgi:mannitol-1-phosphate/altronate dehydrogenase
MMGTANETRSGEPSRVHPLTEATLRLLRPDIAVPTYPREQLKRAIVHFGVGGFHRSHQAVYLDDLAEQRITDQWGLCGVGLLAQDKRMEQALLPQQCLFTVVSRSVGVETARVVGSMNDYLFAPERRAQVLDALTDPDTRLVTLTITEGGYNFNQVTGEFETESPDIQADLRTPHAPATVFGYISEALDRRRRAGVAPFTVLSCDNVQSNGALTRKMIASFATLRDGGLATWIETNVAFPNAMVDRITIQTTDEDRQSVAETFGIQDNWPVVTEPFRQWVIEDTFCNGRPPLEEVGAQFVTDVHPYEMMKIRLLNASHQAMGYLGYLCGYRYVHEAMNDPDFKVFIGRLMDDEVTPLLAPVPGIDLAEYKRSLLERFANTEIKDTLLRLCFDGSSRMPKFLLPSIVEARAAGSPFRLLTLATAGWFRYLLGEDEQGAPIPIQDQMADQLGALAAEGKDDPRPLLGIRSLFGELAQDEGFVTSLQEVLHLLYARGARATLRHYVTTR